MACDFEGNFDGGVLSLDYFAHCNFFEGLLRQPLSHIEGGNYAIDGTIELGLSVGA